MQILSDSQIQNKLNRIAYQIYEDNFEENFAIVGIQSNGYKLAQRITQLIQKINESAIEVLGLNINKTAPLSEKIWLTDNTFNANGKTIILVDDVINTGKTMAYATQFFLNQEVKKLQIATLVDRGHSLFPIKADYVGLALATTLEEHISISIADDGKIEAWLL